MRRRRNTSGDLEVQHSTSLPHENTNFAQRLLMANEMAVTNIADLWVAAAMNVDNDEVFFSDDEAERIDEDSDVGGTNTFPQQLHEPSESSNVPNSVNLYRPPAIDSTNTPRNELQPRRSSLAAPSLASTRLAERAPRTRPSHLPETFAARANRGFRALSTTSSQIPSIYANSGLRAPPGILNEAHGFDEDVRENETSPQETLVERQTLVQPSPSPFKQLPWMIILQYGLLALHSTTHDQVFLSYLVS